MRHAVKHKKLGRTSSHRRAMMRNQLASLIEHERINTTLAKAKALRPVAEKLVTQGRKEDSVHARRLVRRWVADRTLVKKLFEKIDLLYGQFSTRIGTGEVNRAFGEIMRENPPPFSGRKRLKLFYATQTGIKPPTFVLFVNNPDMVHFSYKRYMTNQIREKFHLRHTPIEILFRKKGQPG